MGFCIFCDNILDSSFPNDKMILRCSSCSFSEEPTNEDTLRKERIKGGSVMISDVLLKKAVDDPATEKVFITCRKDKCPGTIAKRVRTGSDERLYNVCMECRTPWLNI
jgi:DNA-directed RNA polymerase subunit M/transcription elongation factor TFIIS